LVGAGVSFGITAAKALEDRVIDGFWANGMGVEIAVRLGVGAVVLDVDGPKACFNYTMASVAAADRLRPQAAAGAVCAIARTQAALRLDIGLAEKVGRKLFPSAEAALTRELVQRDLPIYQSFISPSFVVDMNAFASDLGLLEDPVSYHKVVASQFASLWTR
jgi:NitT/TauT family transport system substrate-binding protein